jgi:cell division septal protein FtsQ
MRKVVIFLFGFLAICSVIYTVATFFRVTEIIVEGSSNVAGLEIYNLKPIWSLHKADIAQSILDKNPKVTKATVSIEYPHTLLISLIETVPTAKLRLSDGFMPLSSEGKIISKERDDVENIKVTIVYYQPLYYRNFSVGDTIDIKEVVDSAYFINEVQKLAIPISSVDIRSENMIVLFSEDREIILSSTKDRKLQIAQLGVVVQQFRQKAMDFSRLDMRFNKPTVVFKK